MDYNKTFEFSHGTDCSSSLQEVISQLQVMKDELNSVKDMLSEYEIIEWGRHTTKMDPASKIVKHVSSSIRPKPFCTNAWCKFYELLKVLRLLDDVFISKSEPLCSVHLCEAPGGFICALNHLIQSENRNGDLQWLANTLNPYHEANDLGCMIPDDRLIRHTIENWLFGRDNTGDITRNDNISNMVEEVSTRFGENAVYMVTADGSRDCQLNPAQQESIVYPIILAEVLTALQIVREGGVAVFKMFTMFEVQTIALLYLLYVTFDKLTVHKPATSKPGNSEVYVTCRGRKDHAVVRETIQKLYLAKESGQPAVSAEGLDPRFLYQILSCAKKFVDIQKLTILNNIKAYKEATGWPSEADLQSNCEEYIEMMELRAIHPNRSLIKHRIRYKKGGDNAENMIYHSINWYGEESSGHVWKPRKRRVSGNFMQRTQATNEQKIAEILASDLHTEQEVKFLNIREAVCAPRHLPADIIDLMSIVTIPQKINKITNNCLCENDLLAEYKLLTSDGTIDNIMQVATDDSFQAITDFVIMQVKDTDPCTVYGDESAATDEFGHNRLFILHFKDTRTLSNILQMIRTGCDLLLHDVNTLLRAVAGAVFFLWHCFDEVAIAGHNQTNFHPSILFRRCILSDRERSELREYLHQKLLAVSSSDTIAELFPLPSILDCVVLNRFLCDINNETLKKSTNRMAHAIKGLSK